MVKKKVPYAEHKIFSTYTLIRTRLYDSAASTASPLGSAVSLAITTLLQIGVCYLSCLIMLADSAVQVGLICLFVCTNNEHVHYKSMTKTDAAGVNCRN